MIQIQDEWLNMLIDRAVKDTLELRIEFTPENTTIEIMPWKPYEMKCPYGERKEHE